MQKTRLAYAIFVTALPFMETEARDSLKYSWNIAADNEGLWNMTTGKGAWNGLLTVEGGIVPWNCGSIEAGAIASYGTGAVADDIQGLSNLDAGENRAFRLIKLGVGQKFGNFSAFAGLRNIDYDYFTSAYTSFFTGSSYGNFPTLSLNHPLPTYPLSALGLHIEYSPTENIVIKESLYTGSASDRFDRQFRIRPASDGFFNIGSISYTAHGNGYSPASYTFNYSVAKMPEGKGKKKIHYALFGNIEQPVATIRNTGIGMLLQGSWSPTHGQEMCRGYAAMAIVAERQNGLMAGIAANRVFTLEGDETDLEFTVGLPLLKYFTLTPSLHCIFTEGNSCNVVGMLRLSFTIGQ